MLTEILIGLCVGISFGYIAGRIDKLLAWSRGEESGSFVSSVIKEQKQRRKVQIDEKKYVTDVSISDLEGSSNPLGTVSKSSDDISEAKNKLAQLKKSKG